MIRIRKTLYPDWRSCPLFLLPRTHHPLKYLMQLKRDFKRMPPKSFHEGDRLAGPEDYPYYKAFITKRAKGLSLEQYRELVGKLQQDYDARKGARRYR